MGLIIYFFPLLRDEIQYIIYTMPMLCVFCFIWNDIKMRIVEMKKSNFFSGKNSLLNGNGTSLYWWQGIYHTRGGNYSNEISM